MGMTRKLPAGDHSFDVRDHLLIRCSGTAAVINNIPDQITEIGRNAFQECPAEEIDLSGSNVRVIDEEAFQLNTSLKTITLPEMEKIGTDAFRDCESLQTVRFSGKVGVIEEQAFMGCRSLQELIFPETGRIGRWAFMNCEELKTVRFTGFVSEIGDEAFFCCSGLREIRFAEVGTIGDCVFFECKKLKSVHFTGTVDSIGEEAFRNCSSLSSLVFDGRVESVGLGAFSYCRNLTEVIIPDGMIDRDSIENGFWTTSRTKTGGLEQHPEGNAPWYLLWKIKEIDRMLEAGERNLLLLSRGKCPFCGGELRTVRERFFGSRMIKCVQCGRKEQEIRAFSDDSKEQQRKRTELAEAAAENPVSARILREYERSRKRPFRKYQRITD